MKVAVITAMTAALSVLTANRYMPVDEMAVRAAEFVLYIRLALYLMGVPLLILGVLYACFTDTRKHLDDIAGTKEAYWFCLWALWLFALGWVWLSVLYVVTGGCLTVEGWFARGVAVERLKTEFTK